MRSSAASKVAWAAVLVTLLLAVSFCLPAQQGPAHCVDPPGGEITCEKGQLATCRVVKGKVEGRCQTPPANLTEKFQLDSWILSQVTNRPVKPSDINKPEFQDILKSGRWQTENEVVTFHLSSSTFGNISQQGRNNIAQQGTNNQATITEADPNKAVVTYDFAGIRRIQSPGLISGDDGENSAFKKLNEMAAAKNWKQMVSLSESEIAKVPEWLSPYFFLGFATANLCEKENAIKNLKYFVDRAKGGPSFDEAVSKAERMIAAYEKGEKPPQCN